ncbi:MAG: hypothetical protein ACREXP_00600 [Steroidobacteraceae bacterium]
MRKILRMCLLGCVVLAPAGTMAAEEFAYDVVIRNGRLLDGLGNPWIRACVAIKDGRIARIGRCDGRGRREIDARERYVSPGWIDLMDQSGEVLPRNGLAENKLLQGVTTAIAGEGGTPVPAGEIDAYFRALEQSGISLNFCMYLYAAGGTGLDITVPNWVWERGVERGLKQLRSPRVHERLKREVLAGSQPGWSNLVHASGGWDHVVLANAFSERYDAYRYKSIEDIGRQLNRDPADVAWDEGRHTGAKPGKVLRGAGYRM